MIKPIHLLFGLLAITAGACDSVELTIGVRPGPESTLLVSNANSNEWVDAVLLVEAVETDNSTSPCAEHTAATWQPGAEVSIPACAPKLRLTLTTGGETARFSWANGKLYRRFGRKEVPVSSD